MDRSNVIMVGTVVGALALFGLKIWSDRTAPNELLPPNQGAGAARFGHAAGEGGMDSDRTGGGPGGRPGMERRAGDLASRRLPGSATTDRGIGSPGGSTRVVRGSAGTSRASGLGVSGSSPASAPGGAASATLGDVTGKPDAERRSHDIVEFLSSQERTRPEPLVDPAATEEDVVLEVASADDTDTKAIDSQNVQPSDDGVGIDLGEDAVLAFPNAGNAKGDAGSISLDIDPKWTGSDATDNSFVQIRTPNGWDNRMQLVKNGRYLRFILTDNTSREADISVPIDHWEPGRPHTVTATWGEGKTQLYIDGQRVGQNTYSGQFQIPPNTPMYVGSDLPGGTYAGAAATIQNFKVYGRRLNDEEVPLR